MEPDRYPHIGRGHRTHSLFWALLVPAAWFFFLLVNSAEFGQRHGDALMWALRGAVAVGFGILAFIAALFFRRERQWQGLARKHPLPPGKKRPFLKGFLWTFLLVPLAEWGVLFAVNPNAEENLTLFVVGLTMGGSMVNLLLALLVGGMGQAGTKTRPTCMPQKPGENFTEYAERIARGGV